MLKLLGNKVAVIPVGDPDKIGSLFVPDMAKERTDQGIVKYVGPECKYVEVGMYVTFSGYSGTAFKVDDTSGVTDERLIILSEDFITAELCDFPNTDVSGLYFKDKDGEYWEATYEMALELMAMAIRDAKWRQYHPHHKTGINVKSIRPRREEYDANPSR